MSTEHVMEVLNFNDGWLIAEVHGNTGVAEIYVLNGCWAGYIDWDALVIWPDAYPNTKIPVASWKVAVRGECEYYQ
jgi:hypothetical protein